MAHFGHHSGTSRFLGFFIYTFTHYKKYNHQVRKYQCTWNPSKKDVKGRVFVSLKEELPNNNSTSENLELIRFKILLSIF